MVENIAVIGKRENVRVLGRIPLRLVLSVHMMGNGVMTHLTAKAPCCFPIMIDMKDILKILEFVSSLSLLLLYTITIHII
jgi:hypothetical protein